MSQARDDLWVTRWLDAVRDGTATMSQRTRSSIDAHGGLEAVITSAKAKGVHLVQLTDDKGRLLIAASLKPFKTLC